MMWDPKIALCKHGFPVEVCSDCEPPLDIQVAKLRSEVRTLQAAVFEMMKFIQKAVELATKDQK
jgi:hypothetical protein